MMPTSFFSNIATYYHTIKYLQPIQLYGQVLMRFRKFSHSINKALPPAQQLPSAAWTSPILKSLVFSLPEKISFLNQEKNIVAATIWHDKNIDKLWLYHLHYFDVLNTVLDAEKNNHCQRLMQRWIKENLPGNGCGWDAYPISLRSVNWMKWVLAGNITTAEMLHSLAIQVRYLRKRLEIHLLGNHILANAKALLFAGLFFQGKEASAWFKKGWQLFNKELAKQILSDGGHIELSPMYHSIILEDVLDVINLFKAYGKTIPTTWLTISDQMFFWLQTMCHADDEIAFFNDAALGMAPTLAQLQHYRQRLLLTSILPRATNKLIHLQHSGYCRVQWNNILLLTDIGQIGASYQPGHGHADTLSFELSYQQQRLLVNSGTSCYSETPERLRQRSSKAHNTLVINQRNSSQVWKSFRVGQRAHVYATKINESNHQMIISASHDGYYASNNILHTRTWTISSNTLAIEDYIAGQGYHTVELFFHIHPAITLQQQTDKKIFFYNQQHRHMATLTANDIAHIVDNTYHPQFNMSLPNKMIIVKIYLSLPVLLKTEITFH